MRRVFVSAFDVAGNHRDRNQQTIFVMAHLGKSNGTVVGFEKTARGIWDSLGKQENANKRSGHQVIGLECHLPRQDDGGVPG